MPQRISAVNTTVSALNATVDKRISAVNTAVSVLNASVDDRISAVNTTVSVLNATVDEKITTVSTTIGAHDVSIAKLLSHPGTFVVASSPGLFPAFQYCTLKYIEKSGDEAVCMNAALQTSCMYYNNYHSCLYY